VGDGLIAEASKPFPTCRRIKQPDTTLFYSHFVFWSYCACLPMEYLSVRFYESIGSAVPNLFEPITIRGVELKNRIAMSPMCMHSATQDGKVSIFHHVHYGARALGGAGLVFLETTAVMPNGLIGPGDIGIWEDSQIDGLSSLTQTIHV
jgi:hypothetical protein